MAKVLSMAVAGRFFVPIEKAVKDDDDEPIIPAFKKRKAGKAVVKKKAEDPPAPTHEVKYEKMMSVFESKPINIEFPKLKETNHNITSNNI